jgi:hypothetical protein
MKISTMIAVVVMAAVVFVTAQLSLKNTNQSGEELTIIDPVDMDRELDRIAATSKPLSEAIKVSRMNESDKTVYEIRKKTTEMDAALNAPIPASDDLREIEAERATVEKLIAQAEAESGQTFSGDLPNVVLDPVKDKEYYELDNKFKQLDAEMQSIVQELQ